MEISNNALREVLMDSTHIYKGHEHDPYKWDYNTWTLSRHNLNGFREGT